ncbi:hypothetical protein Tco_0787522, partial [Tanacetum coccineum]
DCSLDHLKGVNSCFRERVLLENSSVKGLDLNKLLNNHTEFNKLLDDDDVRICLLLALDFVFMGFELRHVIENELLGLVDDLSAWNDFPWGEYMWIELHKRGRNKALYLTPSFNEMKQKCTLEVHHEVDVRTNVHHDVDEGLSVPDAYHDVEEGLSMREILKKISDMQRDFQSRILQLSKFDFSSLTENPHNHVALMKKITDMKPSCGSDVKAGNKEYMCVDSSVKVVEQNEFNQNVANKNLIHDFDQTVEWKMNDEDGVFCQYGYCFTSRMMRSTLECVLINVLEEPQLLGPNFIVEDHQQVSSKNCEVSLAGAKKIAVDALIKIINFEIPKEPESTQQNHKVRARNKKVKKKGLPLTTHDGKVIPDWKEAKKGVGGCLIRQVYADKLPKLLIQSEVMEKKNIDPSNYSISYRYAVNVPRQGKFTGDCAISVMRNLYRLLNNLPLERSAREDNRRDLLDFGMALTRSERRYWLVGKNLKSWMEQSYDGRTPMI